MANDKEEQSEALECSERERGESECRTAESSLNDDAGVNLGTKETFDGMAGHDDQQLVEEENSTMLARIRAEFGVPGRLQNATTGQLIELFRLFSAEARRGTDRIMPGALGEDP